MGRESGVQWVHSSVNPVSGCDGCELWDPKRGIKICYAGVMTERYAGHNKGFPASFDVPEKFPGRMAAAARWGPPTPVEQAAKPWLPKDRRVIFVEDMGDALSQSIDFEYLETEIIDNVRGTPHIWMWLTKRAGRMWSFDQYLLDKGVTWPDNLWIGTSVTDQASGRRVRDLADCRAKVKFISGEPQSSYVDPESIPGSSEIDLWIQGGMSGAQAKPFDVRWAVKWSAWCAANGKAYFLKQFGAHVVSGGVRLKFKDSHAGDWNEWGEAFRIRQWPEVN